MGSKIQSLIIKSDHAAFKQGRMGLKIQSPLIIFDCILFYMYLHTLYTISAIEQD